MLLNFVLTVTFWRGDVFYKFMGEEIKVKRDFKQLEGVRFKYRIFSNHELRIRDFFSILMSAYLIMNTHIFV